LAEITAKLEDFTKKGCSVGVVSCGTIEGARTWIKRHGVNLPLYVDESKSLYCALRLGRRCTLINTHINDVYARKIMNDVEILPLYEGDDVFTVAGDFIFTKGGKIVYKYITEDNERPPVHELLQVINEL
jgi:peroxiredoxin